MLSGVAIGAIFDVYRALRKWWGWGRFLTFVGDLLFSLTALAILFVFLRKANWLDFRLYSVWGSLLGLFLYLKLFSRGLVRLHLKMLGVFSWFSRQLLKGVKLPFLVVAFLMRPPYAMLRWISLLFYRIGEALFAGPVTRGAHRVHRWWDRIIPPRTKD